MTSREIDKKWTPAKIKAMIEKAKKMPVDESEIPTDEDFASGRIRFLRRGRPPKAHPKKRVDLRFDQDVLSGLRSYFGRGWSTRVNDTMRGVLSKAGVL
jgi:uncharacterized protein (DUF4415 family)